jgi:transcriptional regulator with XRE-family HTH domain
MTLPEFIAECRRLAKKTQMDFATELKVHKQTVSDWERGKMTPSIESLREMAVLAGTSLEACLSIPDIEADTADEQKILRLFRSLSGRRRDHAISLLEDLAQLQRRLRKPK